MDIAHQEISTLLNESYPLLPASVKDIISQTAVLMQVKKGALITRQGQLLRNAILVGAGFMKVYREGPDGEIFMYYLEAGQACAMSFVCAQGRETSGVMIKALEDSLVILLPLPVMDRLMRESHDWNQFVVNVYRARFDNLLQAFDDVVFKKLDERLLRYLYDQSAKTGSRTLQITHQQIADDMHSTREAVSRLLKTMEQQGLLAINRNSELLKTGIVRS
ncbi:Crp/Fnr family transcriptional regulator [Chitinophaga flava]|uniref:Crp/Fnr family transcriptional regulator n=1 Tax=Chitinophaga flava TaxID=2259036 RepID=A0A365XZD4_9BACT|nr:Crp/Fnr family transcriptional regulator [Chitinophaga flava]RBL91693.1 Crp/Fnr family transcriptional regulator [Chitinophaga flava]